jgi:hypothetical protein
MTPALLPQLCWRQLRWEEYRCEGKWCTGTTATKVTTAVLASVEVGRELVSREVVYRLGREEEAGNVYRYTSTTATNSEAPPLCALSTVDLPSTLGCHSRMVRSLHQGLPTSFPLQLNLPTPSRNDPKCWWFDGQSGGS